MFIEPDAKALAEVPAAEGDLKISAAITNFDGTADFYFYQDGTHSLLQTNLAEIHRYIDGYSGKPARVQDWTCREKIQVPCFTLHTLICRHRIDRIPALKVDAQGHDLEVIKSLGASLAFVNRIECEVQVTPFEVYKNQTDRRELIAFLHKENFRLIRSERQTFDQEENLIFLKSRWLDFFYRRFKRFRKSCSSKEVGA